MRSTLTNVRFWIGMLISVVAVYVAYSRVDVDEAVEAFREANYLWVVPAASLTVVSLIARTFRWNVLLLPTRISRFDLFGILNVGYTVTTLVPFRLGDFVRVFLVGGLHGVRKVRTLSTIVVERALDVLAVIVILLTLIPFVPMSGRVRAVMWFGAAGIAMIFAAIIVSWFMQDRALRGLRRIAQRLPGTWDDRIVAHAASVIDGFAVLGSRGRIARALVWTAVTWLSGGAMMWVMLIALDLPHSPSIALFLLAMSALSMVIPSSPGFVGVYHALLIETLVTIFDAPSGTAASFAVMTHLLLFVPPVVFGSLYMLKEPEIWSQLLRFRQRADDPEPVPSEPRGPVGNEAERSA